MTEFLASNGKGWQRDFARLYAAREACTVEQADFVAHTLCPLLGLVPPAQALTVVSGHHELAAALRRASFARPDPQ